MPAYEALRKSEKTGEEMFEALLKGVSTRNYREVIPEANSAGVSKSPGTSKERGGWKNCWRGAGRRSRFW